LTDKSFFDHVSDWFRILLRSGLPALLVGLGWVSTFLTSLYLGSAWLTNAVYERTGAEDIANRSRLFLKGC